MRDFFNIFINEPYLKMFNTFSVTFIYGAVKY